jgi:hypothetical protein
MKYVVLLALVLSGCAAQKELVWDKPGSSQQQFYQDLGQCRAQAFSVASGNLYQIAIVQNSCMQGKGWQLVER